MYKTTLTKFLIVFLGYSFFFLSPIQKVHGAVLNIQPDYFQTFVLPLCNDQPACTTDYNDCLAQSPNNPIECANRANDNDFRRSVQQNQATSATTGGQGQTTEQTHFKSVPTITSQQIQDWLAAIKDQCTANGKLDTLCQINAQTNCLIGNGITQDFWNNPNGLSVKYQKYTAIIQAVGACILTNSPSSQISDSNIINSLNNLSSSTLSACQNNRDCVLYITQQCPSIIRNQLSSNSTSTLSFITAACISDQASAYFRNSPLTQAQSQTASSTTQNIIPGSIIAQLEAQIKEDCDKDNSNLSDCYGTGKKVCFGNNGIDTNTIEWYSNANSSSAGFSSTNPNNRSDISTALAATRGCVATRSYILNKSGAIPNTLLNKTGVGGGQTSSGKKATAAYLSFPFEKDVFQTDIRQQIYDANTSLNNTTFTIPGSLPQPTCPTKVYDLRLSVFHEGSNDPSVYHYKLTYNCSSGTGGSATGGDGTTNSSTTGTTTGTNSQTSSSGSNQDANSISGPSCTYSQTCPNGAVITCNGTYHGNSCGYTQGVTSCSCPNQAPNYVCTPGSYKNNPLGCGGCSSGGLVQATQCKRDGSGYANSGNPYCDPSYGYECSGQKSGPSSGSACSGYPQSCTKADGSQGAQFCSPGIIQSSGSCGYNGDISKTSCTPCQ